MAAPLDAAWGTESVTPTKLNQTTYGQGTSFPSTWKVDRMFWRTDENIVYKNTGTEGTPVWTNITSAMINSATMPTSQSPNELWNETLSNYRGNIYRLYDNLNGVNVGESESPLKKYFALTTIDSPTDRLFEGGLCVAEDFTQYTSDANIELIWDEFNADNSLTYDSTNNWIQIRTHTLTNSSTTKAATLDLGGTLSDTWIARIEWDLYEHAQGSGSNWIAMGASFGSNSNPDNPQNNQGFAGQVNITTDRFQVTSQGGQTLENSMVQAFAFTPSVTTYYVEIRKSTGNLEVEFFSNSAYTTSIEEEIYSATDYADLRYLHLWGYNFGTTTGHQFNPRWKKVEMKHNQSTW